MCVGGDCKKFWAKLWNTGMWRFIWSDDFLACGVSSDQMIFCFLVSHLHAIEKHSKKLCCALFLGENCSCKPVIYTNIIISIFWFDAGVDIWDHSRIRWHRSESGLFGFSRRQPRLTDASSRQDALLLWDDTWMRLFPGHFTEADGTTSFFVTDYTEVCNSWAFRLARFFPAWHLCGPQVYIPVGMLRIP